MTGQHSRQAPQKTSARAEIILIFGSLLAVVAIMIIVIFLLVREREDANEAAVRASSNIVRLIDADVMRNAELYDTSLRGMISTWQMPEIHDLAPNLRHLVLFDRSTAARYKGDLLLLDQQGNIVADSTSLQPRPYNLADRAHFQEHMRNPSLDLKVGAPFKARWGFKDWCISFSRRISGDDGSFQGVASAAMRLVYFKQLLRTLDIGPDSNVTLFNADGALLARHPEVADKELIGQNFADSPNFKRIVKEGNGSFISASSMDGKKRLYTFSQVEDLPLIVVVGQSVQEVYAIWNRNVLLVGFATAVLCLGILWLAVLLRKELHLRQQAENELRRHASTDALTGLANRRRLDEVMHSEWLRAARSGKPVSLLVIDVDHFKIFNDRHGHYGGDEALRNVAAIIASSVRRPGDFVARYGGEEFVVVLGETDLDGARNLAEVIRKAVEGIAPYTTDSQPLTVSIGIACANASPGEPFNELFNAADSALYNAKSKGRNRVECSQRPV